MAKPYTDLAPASGPPSVFGRTQSLGSTEHSEWRPMQSSVDSAQASRFSDFFDLVETRRSVRSFTNEAVTERELERILEAANRAPSAGNLQAYDIVVVTERDRRLRLCHAAYNQPALADVPLLLAFVANPERSARRYAERGERFFAPEAATIAAAYAGLAAHALGLASVWVGAFDERAVADALEAPEGRVPCVLLAIGHAAESPPPTPRRDLRELVHRERMQPRAE